MAAPNRDSPNRDEAVCVGVIAGARGLKGEVRIKTFTAEPAGLTAYGPLSDETGGRRFDVQVTGAVRGQVVARLAGVDDRDGAEALKGVHLFVPRSALPKPGEDEYYYSELVGLRVERRGGGSGEVLGTVRAVFDFGAGDVLEVECTGGETVLIPFTREAVPEVDVGAGYVVVDPPDGLLDSTADRKKEGGGT